MVDENKTRPIVIKKVKKSVHGHHGGSWKIAFADFMTAMFAVFLVLWLLEVLEEDQLQALGDYFRDPSVVEFEPGARRPEPVDLEGATREPIHLGDVPVVTQDWQTREQLYDVSDEVFDAVTEAEELAEYRDQVTMEMTEDGLRIQLVDQEGRPMFERGSPELQPQARELLRVLTGVLKDIENPISVSGHTDAVGFARDDYDNWSLSTDRAHAARFAMMNADLPQDRFFQVVGYADAIPFDAEDPYAAVNRRISVLVMTHQALERIADRERGTGEEVGLERLERDPVELLTPEERRRREAPPGEEPPPEEEEQPGERIEETPEEAPAPDPGERFEPETPEESMPEPGEQLLTPEEMQRRE